MRRRSPPAMPRWRNARRRRDSILDGLPRSASVLRRAHALCVRAASVGFDWNGPAPVLQKVREELGELEAAFAARPRRRAALAWEIGDLFFALANLARHLDLDAEKILAAANGRFAARFREVERLARSRGIDMRHAGLSLLDQLWEEAKKNLAAR